MGTNLRAALRSGDWVTSQRIRNYSIILIACGMLSLLWLVATSTHLTMPDGQPLGTDFSDIFSAGKLALHGSATRVYDWTAHHAAQKDIFGAETPFYAWSYPPPFLLIASLTALMPYGLALLLWQAVTLVLYTISIRTILQPVTEQWLLPALGFTAVLINLANGHNGFLSAFLFGLGLACVRTRPFLAGVLLGALCYKPHFGLLIPVALLAAREGKTFFAATVTVCLLATAATIAYGPDIWPAFTASLEPTRTIILEQGDTGWYKIQSLFAAARNLGASLSTAYALHGLLALFVLVVTTRAWHRHGAEPRTCALLLIGALLTTPYLLDYDLMILGPALAFLTLYGLHAGFAPYQKSLLTAVWLMPFLARTVMEHTGIPLGFLTLLLLFVHTAYCSSRHTSDGNPSLA